MKKRRACWRLSSEKSTRRADRGKGESEREQEEGRKTEMERSGERESEKNERELQCGKEKERERESDKGQGIMARSARVPRQKSPSFIIETANGVDADLIARLAISVNSLFPVIGVFSRS